MNSILRIIPLYYISLIVFLLLNYLGVLNEHPSIINIISHFFLFSVISPVWWNTFAGTGYISVLVASWVFFFFYKRRIKDFETSLITFVLKVFIVKFSLIQNHLIWNEYIGYIFRGIQSFSFAPVIYYFPKTWISSLKFPRFISYSLICISSICIVIALLYNVSDNIIYIALSIPFLLGIQIYEIKFVVNKFFCFLGKYIFGIYLGHILIYIVISSFIDSITLIWFLDITLAIGFSILVNHFIENPFKVFVDKWRK